MHICAPAGNKVYVTDSGFTLFSVKTVENSTRYWFHVIKFTYMVNEIRKWDHEMQFKIGLVV